jgi:hypothetical protein
MKTRLKSIHKDSLQEAEQVKLFVILHSVLFGNMVPYTQAYELLKITK